MIRDQPQKPSAYARSIVLATMKSSPPQQIPYVFHLDDELLDSYIMDVVRAIRKSDIRTLRQFLNDGQSFDACNRNGETFLHLACRCSKTEIIEFLIDEANANVNARDGLGRTILHDACWRPLPDLQLLSSLLRRIPIHMILTEDIRGHSCFDYCRKEHWNQWNEFLKQQTDIIERRICLLETSDGSFSE